MHHGTIWIFDSGLSWKSQTLKHREPLVDGRQMLWNPDPDLKSGPSLAYRGTPESSARLCAACKACRSSDLCHVSRVTIVPLRQPCGEGIHRVACLQASSRWQQIVPDSL